MPDDQRNLGTTLAGPCTYTAYTIIPKMFQKRSTHFNLHSDSEYYVLPPFAPADPYAHDLQLRKKAVYFLPIFIQLLDKHQMCKYRKKCYRQNVGGDV